jgi:hypothetical protein
MMWINERAISQTIIGLKYTTLMMLSKEYILACNLTFKLVFMLTSAPEVLVTNTKMVNSA